jgi:hypothetical protein
MNGILERYWIHPENGFLGDEPPTIVGHVAFDIYEEMVAQVPKLLHSSQLQTFVVEKLPLVPDSVINDQLSYNQCRRALLITSIIAHAYIWQQSALASGETSFGICKF